MDQGERRSAWAWVAITAAVIVGVALRIYGLDGHPLWLDEAYSAFAADKGLAFIWKVLPGYETHPPFYSAALHAWTLAAGNSLLGFRSFGLLAGLLTLPVMWMGGRELALLTHRRSLEIALPAMVLAATAPSLIDMSRLVRPYAWMVLVFACGVWALLRIARLHAQTGRLSLRPYLAYLVSQALLVWLHNLGALYVAALGLTLLYLIGPTVLMRAHTRAFFVGHALVLAAVSPALLIMLDQASTWKSSTWLRFDPAAVLPNLGAIFSVPGLIGAIGAAALIGMAFAAPAPQRRAVTALMIAAFTAPLLAIALSIAVTPVFLPRTLVACAPPFLLAMAVATWTSLPSRTVFILYIALVLQRAVLINQLPPEQDWYGVVNWLAPRVRPGDKIYAYPNEGALPLGYALRDLRLRAAVRPIPSEVPARDPAGWYPTGSRGVQSLPAARLAEIANDAESRNIPTIWLLRVDRHIYDKGDAFANILAGARRRTERYENGNIELIAFAAEAGPEVRAPE